MKPCQCLAEGVSFGRSYPYERTPDLERRVSGVVSNRDDLLTIIVRAR